MNTKKELPQSCEIQVPERNANPHEFVSRWSDAGVELPSAIVAPSNGQDVIATIDYAIKHGLKVIPANGGHASFLPINSHAIYLDLRELKATDLDEEKQEVKIGGGCVAGEVLRDLAEKGWYTLTPNSNSVGMIGAFLGGLSSSLNGVHGFAIDHVREIRIIPFSTPENKERGELVLTPESTGEEKNLFNVLCGAGHGLGVITSITLRAWHMHELNMSDDKIWTRRLIFPTPAITTAAEVYTSLLPPPPELSVVLAFLRAPPTAPKPGAPMIMLALSYFGPTSDAAKIAAKTFEEDVVSKAVTAVTIPIEYGKMNDGIEALNRHGGFKEYHGAFCKEVDAESIHRAFKSWENFTGENMGGRAGSYVVIGSWSTTALERNAGVNDEKFFAPRDHGVFVQATPWYSGKADKLAADHFGANVVRGLREKDRSAGRKDWCFANNLLAGQDVAEVYTKKQIEEIERVKGVWDASGVGWSPIVDGW